MYQKPEVQRFGSLREITLFGCDGVIDISTLVGNPSGIDNCNSGGDSGRS